MQPNSESSPKARAEQFDLEGEADTRRFGRALATTLEPRDTVLLIGDLGAGKSTLARAAVQAFLGTDTPVPSPTFTLMQEYEIDARRFIHADLYRLSDEGELEELGLLDAFGRALCFIEWPERLGHLTPATAVKISLSGDGGTRSARIEVMGEDADIFFAALDRAMARERFVESAGWGAARISPLAGDASRRRYFRLLRDGETAMLMDAPPQTDGSAPSFARVTELLHGLEAGLSVPRLLHQNTDAGFLLLEDFGDDLFSALLADGRAEETELYGAAVDLLHGLKGTQTKEGVQQKEGAHEKTELPPYDMEVLLREAALLTDWWMPAAEAPPSEALRTQFLTLMEQAVAPIADERGAIVLRDYHAENLIWLPERYGAERIGLLDYQDALIGHPAYDLVSLLEDARRDVSPALAQAMITRFLEARPDLDPDAFRAAYDILGAQRNAKIVGIFARLAKRDGKPRYLDLIPRVWAHLQRDLRNPYLAGLRDWIEEHVPEPTPERLAAIKTQALAQ